MAADPEILSNTALADSAWQPEMPVPEDGVSLKAHRQFLLGAYDRLHTDLEIDALGRMATVWLADDNVAPTFRLIHQMTLYKETRPTWFTGQRQEEIKETPIAEGWYIGQDLRTYRSDPARRHLEIPPHRLQYYLVAGRGMAAGTQLLSGKMYIQGYQPNGLDFCPDLYTWSDTQEMHLQRLRDVRGGIISLLAKNQVI